MHATASFIDPEFMGTITLELSNLGHLPVRLYTLAKVASIAFFKIFGDVKRAYRDSIPSPLEPSKTQLANHYAAPKSEASKHHEDWEYRIIQKIRAKMCDLSAT